MIPANYVEGQHPLGNSHGQRQRAPQMMSNSGGMGRPPPSVSTTQKGFNTFTYSNQHQEIHTQSMPWFHGKISREEAEELLVPREDGLFLVRESKHYPGDYTLCVACANKVEHYHIKCDRSKLTIDDEVHFDNLVKLVKYYQGEADGLCTRLIRPVPKQGAFDVTVNVEEFRTSGWAIPAQDLQLGEPLGDGEFGTVYKATYKGKTVAAKSLKETTSKAVQSFLKEASVMTSLRHPNLVQLIGVVVGEIIILVTEFMDKGSLVEYLRSRGRAVITKKQQIEFASDTCNAMAYLERKNLVHRDLAARNVLVNDHNIAKVSDFGLALGHNVNPTGGKFPIKWTAPEALRESKFTSKSDMWSFGILLWEIYSFGRVPYPRIPLADVVMHVEKGYRMEAPEGCPKEIYDIMMRAWKIQPEGRPTFQEVYQELTDLKSITV
ncbi:tyrosine-protein kinase CSK-like isoform X2 [Liolophura sinensis]